MGDKVKTMLPLAFMAASVFLPAGVGQLVAFGVSMLSAVLFQPKTPEGAPQAGGPDRKQLIRSAVSPHRVIYGIDRVGGTLVFSESTGEDKRFLHLVMVWTGHECAEVVTHYLNEVEIEPGQIDAQGMVRAGDFADHVLIRDHLGTPGQPADSTLVSASKDWTPAHKLSGRCYTYFRFEYDRDVFPSNIPVPSVVLRGKNDIFDPRDQSVGWSDNWALCVRDYLAGDHGYGAPDSQIDDDLVIAAANISDELVELATDPEDEQQYQRRYQMNGSFARDGGRGDILRQMTTAGAGSLSFSGGVWRMWAGAFYQPDVDIDERWLRGPVSVTADAPLAERYSAVRGKFTPLDPNENEEFPARLNATYEAEDGRLEYQTLDLPFTNDQVMAQRLAEIALRKSRQGIKVTLPCNLMAYTVALYDTVALTLDQFGFDQKPFVVTAFTMSDGGGVDLVLMEESSASYDWDMGQELTRDPAPDSNLASPRFVGTPRAFGVETGPDLLALTGDGRLVARARLVWQVPAETPFMAGYELAWRLQSDGNQPGGGWSYAAVDGRATEMILQGPLIDGALYDFHLYGLNSFGVRSRDPAMVLSHRVIGKTSPPSRPQTFTVQKNPDGTRSFVVALDNPPPDVRVGGGYAIRYTTTPGAAWDDMKRLHDGLLAAFPFESSLPAAPGNYEFEARAVDSSGLESDGNRVKLFLGDSRINEIIHAQFDHQIGWPGTITNCFRSVQGQAEVLEVSSTENWDDLPDDWDSLPDTWDDLLANYQAFSYVTEVIDLKTAQGFDPLISWQTDGVAGVEIKTGGQDDGGVVGDFKPVAQQSGVRYLQTRIVIGDGYRLAEFSIQLDGAVITEIYEDIELS